MPDTGPRTAGKADDLAMPPTAMRVSGGEPTAPMPAPVAEPDLPVARPSTLLDISELAETHDDPLLASHIRSHVRLVNLQPGLLDICLTDGAPDSLPGEIARRLSEWTGERWMVSLSDGQGSMTIVEERREARQREFARIAETPLVKTIMDVFPGAEIESVEPVDQTDTDQPNGDIQT